MNLNLFDVNNEICNFSIQTTWIQYLLKSKNWSHLGFASCRHEAELASAAAQPLPDDDDEAFE